MAIELLNSGNANNDDRLPQDGHPSLSRRDVLASLAFAASSIGLGCLATYAFTSARTSSGVRFDPDAPAFDPSKPPPSTQIQLSGTITSIGTHIRRSIPPSSPVVIPVGPGPTPGPMPMDIINALEREPRPTACFKLTVEGAPDTKVEVRCVPEGEDVRILEKTPPDTLIRIHGVIRTDEKSGELYIFRPWIVHPATGEAVGTL